MRALPIWLLILAAIVMAVPLAAEDSNAPKPEPGHITGTVTDVNDDVLSGATVVLEGAALKQPRTVVSNDNGSFEFNDLEPGTYTVSISAKGFAVKIEEQQRVFGIFPNFYVVYYHDPAPLTTKLKFRLALKTSTDPVTILGVAALAGINQAAVFPTTSKGGRVTANALARPQPTAFLTS